MFHAFVEGHLRRFGLADLFRLDKSSKVRFRRYRSTVFSILATLFHLFKNSIDGAATRRSLIDSQLLSQSVKEGGVHVIWMISEVPWLMRR
jgi:hypothetical protein